MFIVPYLSRGAELRKERRERDLSLKRISHGVDDVADLGELEMDEAQAVAAVRRAGGPFHHRNKPFKTVCIATGTYTTRHLAKSSRCLSFLYPLPFYDSLELSSDRLVIDLVIALVSVV